MVRTFGPSCGPPRGFKTLLAVLVLAGFGLRTGLAARAAEVRVDCAKPLGLVRPLHGGNCGPVSAGGLVDVSEHFRALGIPLIRLHDCHWPDPNVIDVHAVFPELAADPADP